MPLPELKLAADRLRLIPAHDSLILLKASCGSPKLTHILRSLSCANHNIILDIDATLPSYLINISYVNIINMQWQQASLQIKAGGLGIKNKKFTASPAFFASCFHNKTASKLFAVSISNRFLGHHYDFYLNDRCKNNQPIQLLSVRYQQSKNYGTSL